MFALALWFVSCRHHWRRHRCISSSQQTDHTQTHRQIRNSNPNSRKFRSKFIVCKSKVELFPWNFFFPVYFSVCFIDFLLVEIELQRSYDGSIAVDAYNRMQSDEEMLSGFNYTKSFGHDETETRKKRNHQKLYETWYVLHTCCSKRTFLLVSADSHFQQIIVKWKKFFNHCISLWAQ